MCFNASHASYGAEIITPSHQQVVNIIVLKVLNEYIITTLAFENQLFHDNI